MTRRSAPPGRFVIAAFDALAASVSILDGRGEILAVNQAWETFAGENGGGSSLGSNYLRVCDLAEGEDGADAHNIAAGIRAVLAGEQELYEYEYPCHVPSGPRYYVVRVTCFVQDEERYAVVAHENITRQKLAELEVRELAQRLEARVEERTRELEASRRALEVKNVELELRNQELAQFAHVASHDLQEPLRTLGLHADILRQRYRGRQLDERADRYLDHIGQQVQRARQLVQDVLTFSNISAEPPLSRMELRPLWEEVSRELSWPSDARLSCGPLPAVRANAGQLRQLFVNLLGNAVKFRAARPLEVSLRAWREAGPDGDGPVHFALSDNGVGISPGHAEQVFVMFQRLHSRALTHGNGIGLAVCRKVIEQHGGRIWVEGEEGVGTTVHFTLPAG